MTPNRPEIFFGLVGAAGTDLKLVTSKLSGELQQVGYKTLPIRLSRELEKLPKFASCAELAFDAEKIEALMDAGDICRRTVERGDAVGLLGVAEIRRLRKELTGSERQRADRTAFVLHSLKRPEETRTLRSAYGPMLFVVSVFAPISKRTNALCRRIATSHETLDERIFLPQAQRIIERDKKDASTNLGQDVENTFPEADFFLDATSDDALDNQISRLVKIIFGHPFMTPTVDEYGMFHAKAASLRSSDLSRQVGAIIATPNGEILAAGCNEVPRANVGTNWDDVELSVRDYRDFRRGYDSTARMKKELLDELFEKLADWLKPEYREFSPAQLSTKALHEGHQPALKGSRFDSLLEFGRMVHAEMAAITEAARRGVAIGGSRLFSTTFPCHMCARHIIASGIKEVVYIEPYPKSMAKELYEKMIKVDDESGDEDAIVFKPFVGVSPRRFIEFFQAPRRKDRRGLAAQWDAATASCRVEQIADYHPLEIALMIVHDEIRSRLAVGQLDLPEIGTFERSNNE